MSDPSNFSSTIFKILAEDSASSLFYDSLSLDTVLINLYRPLLMSSLLRLSILPLDEAADRS